MAGGECTARYGAVAAGRALLAALCGLLAACGTPAPRPAGERAEPPATAAPATPPPAAGSAKRGGGYYQDDGPGDNPPPDLAAVPDAVPRSEPPHRFANKPYSVFGRDYVPLPAGSRYRARGVASWYGRKFHGQKTSSGEVYDMYAMTAAHPTLPIPSYVRVSNPANGKSVVVRVNDRGPFHAGRLIDLSYTAAWKLGYIGNGSTTVEVESIEPGRPVLAAAAADEDALNRLATEPPPSAMPELRDARGHYLQLGAFGSRDNAEALRSRLAGQLDAAADRLGDKLVVQASGKLYRLQLGPWADAGEARRIAERIRDTLELEAVVVQR